MCKPSVSPGSVQKFMPSYWYDCIELGWFTDIILERSERTRRKYRLRHLFYCRVTYYVSITEASHWSAGGHPAENGLLPSRNLYCCLTSPAGVPRDHCCAMPWANPSQYIHTLKNKVKLFLKIEEKYCYIGLDTSKTALVLY
jgi:hypothetical protein